MLFVSFLPALTYASTIILPSTPTQNLGSPPFSREGQLYAGPPSHSGFVLDNTRHFNNYSINLLANTAYTFRLSTFDFNALWFLTDSAGNVLLSSVDAKSVSDAQELRFIPATTATYYIIVSSVLGTETGSYTLSASTISDFATISGRVLNDSNQPLGDAEVTAYRQVNISGQMQFVPEFSTTTAADGSFSLTPLIPGNYRISFFDLSLAHGALYYQGAEFFEDALTVNAPANGQVTLTDTVLQQGAAITGTVTDQNNVPLENILVTAYLFAGSSAMAVASVETCASGTYALTGLATANYLIGFSCMDGLFITQYYDRAYALTQADTISAAIGTVTPNIDARLSPAATITGTVRNSANAPIGDIVVSLLRVRAGITAPASLECFEIVAQNFSEDDGSYFFGGLDTDTYFLHFSDPEGRFLDIFYLDAFIPARAGPIEVVRGNHLSGKDINLVRTSTLSGTVTDTSSSSLSGITVRLFNLEDAPVPITQEFLENPSFETYTDDFGNFSFSSLIPGTYLLEFSDTLGIHSTLYYSNQADPNLGDDIVIVPNTHLTGRNATLTAASSITGTLVDELTGLPLNGGRIFLFDTQDISTPLISATTTSNGSFILGGLDGGTYYLGFVPLGYQVPESLQFFDGAFSVCDATPISIGIGETRDLDELLWKQLPHVTLTLNAQNNTSPQRITAPINSSVNTLPTPTHLGHRFEGWHTSPSGGSLVQMPLILTEDATLYAHWRAADFILTFDSRGGNVIANRFLYFGDQIGTLPTPVRAGHTFMGWFDRPVGGFRMHANDFATRSMTIYAQWRPLTHTVTFNSQGGSFVASRNVLHGQTVGALPTPIRVGHTFQGWFTASTGGTRIQSGHVVTQNMTLHARWQVQMATIRLDANGGRALNPITRAIGTRLGSLPTPTRNNRVFARWTTDRAGNRPVNANTVVNGNMTLFAQWRSNDARLRNISRSAGTLNRPFTPNRLNYTLRLRASRSSVRITAIPRCDSARVSMRTSSNRDWQNTRSRSASVPRGSSRTLQIRVVSEDRQNRFVYRITIRRAR